ncbi:hypothetical protein ACFVH6_30450 [Spirillospora sp. NPDC127200]
MSYADPTERAAFIAGLRELADYLAATPEVPVPQYGAEVTLFPSGDDDAARFAQVDRLAAVLGVPVCDRTADGGHYIATRCFGPVALEVVASTEASRAAYDALTSYRDNVQPEPPVGTGTDRLGKATREAA